VLEADIFRIVRLAEHGQRGSSQPRTSTFHRPSHHFDLARCQGSHSTGSHRAPPIFALDGQDALGAQALGCRSNPGAAGLKKHDLVRP